MNENDYFSLLPPDMIRIIAFMLDDYNDFCSWRSVNKKTADAISKELIAKHVEENRKIITNNEEYHIEKYANHEISSVFFKEITWSYVQIHPYYNIGEKSTSIFHKYITHYFKNKKLHRDNDKPAIIIEHPFGNKESYDYLKCTKEYHWYKDGKRHRENGAAIILNCGISVWYENGKYIKDNGINDAELCKHRRKHYFHNNSHVIAMESKKPFIEISPNELKYIDDIDRKMMKKNINAKLIYKKYINDEDHYNDDYIVEKISQDEYDDLSYLHKDDVLLHFYEK